MEPSHRLFQTFCDLEQAIAPHTHLYDKAGFAILKCSGCGLVKTHVEPGRFAIDTIYDESYFEGGQADGYAAYGASRPVHLKQARRVLRLLDRYRTGNRLLEVGCAYGFFLEEAARLYEAVGIDVSEHAVARARAQGLDARVGTIEGAGLPDAHFDAVAILETIEHLPSPFAVLSQAARVSRPGAALVVSTGDIDSLLGRLCGRRWRLMTPPQHLYFFSKKTLAELARRTGWEPQQIEYSWRDIPLGLGLYQLFSRTLGWRRIPVPASLGVPVNLFDVMTMVAVRRGQGPPRRSADD
jgi:SAM-dependent methyltransferase